MKKSVTLALLLTLGLGPVLASAHEDGELGIKAAIKTDVRLGSEHNGTTTGSTTRDHEDRDDQGNGGRGGEISGIKAELKGGLRADMVRANIKAAAAVYTATIARLQKIITRIESRITKVNALGEVTTEATTDVNLAKTSISDAQAQITIFSSLNFGTTTSTTTLATNYQTARAAAVKAREDLTDAKKNLMKALEVLVKAEVKVHANASTTATTTSH